MASPVHTRVIATRGPVRTIRPASMLLGQRLGGPIIWQVFTPGAACLWRPATTQAFD
jgi:hypothetical protein